MTAPPTSLGSHHTHETKAKHARRIKLDRSHVAAHKHEVDIPRGG